MLSMISLQSSKKFSVRFCAFEFLALSTYAIVDAADSGADAAGAVVHVGSVARAGIGVFRWPAVAPSAKSWWNGRQLERMDEKDG